MTGALIRKVRQLVGDPVLRRWLAARALGLTPAEPAYTAHHPPYLGDRRLENGSDVSFAGPDLPRSEPSAPLRMVLPGQVLDLVPGEADTLFSRSFVDTETLLGLHRFAWLPLAGEAADPAWVDALWRAWAERHGEPDSSWAWHPYTAAERAINILDFARRRGLPGPREATLALLGRHGAAIAARLEYFGEHYTGNHMANNGRGLYLLGLALGCEATASLGRDILLAEARRIFLGSGVLREGSTHYHLLLTRGYVSAWLAARRHRRPEAAELERVAASALAVLPTFDLPGGLPLVGDVSPDCPPAFLGGLLPSGRAEGGWTAGLDVEERHALACLAAAAPLPSAAALAADGYLRHDQGEWAGLWHAAPEGWAHIPGHGHQDLGAFELHLHGVPLFIDPGRGAYGDEGEAALYRSAAVHGLVQVDGADPYPPNRPYYHPSFRQALGGAGPSLERLADGVRLCHHGFGRQGVTLAERRWVFGPGRMILRDRLEGGGHHHLRRALTTPWPAETTGDGAVIRLPGHVVRVRVEVPLVVRPLTRWTAYGEGERAFLLVAEERADLPWSGEMGVEVTPCVE